MKTTMRRVAHAVGLVCLAAGVATGAEAGSRQPIPRAPGAAPRATAPERHAGSAPRSVTPGANASPRGTATGVARYGYGHGGTTWVGYPWWNGGWGWYGGWGGYGYGYGYGYGFPAYGSWYPPFEVTYVASVTAPSPRGPAIVETAVSPSKAEVVLDGEVVGFASDYSGRWDRLNVDPGPHTIVFQKKGYRALVVEFKAHPGVTYSFNDVLVPGEGEDRRTLQEADAEPPPATRQPIQEPIATGRLRVHAVPADAAVYLDGEYLGLGAELDRIHGSLAVAAGSHRLEAVRPGYVTAVQMVEVGGSDIATVELSLERER